MSSTSDPQSSNSKNEALFAYVGNWPGFNEEPGAGVYGFRVDLRDGALESINVASVPDPSHITVSAAGVVYAVTRTCAIDGEPGGGAFAFAIDRDSGALTPLNRLRLPANHPMYVSLDHSERWVLTAAGMGGAVMTLSLDRDGRLADCASVVRTTERPLVPLGAVWKSILDGPIPSGSDSVPHCIRVAPSNRYAFACDIVANRVTAFRFDSRTGALTPHEQGDAEIAAARHLAFHPSGRTAYVCEEHGNRVTVLHVDDEAGSVAQVESRSTLPAGFGGKSATADIHVHPSGRWLYVSNRGHDSLVAFDIDPVTGALGEASWYPTGGRTPRGFAVAPGGELVLVANQESSTINAHLVRPDGTLEHTGTVASVPAPTTVGFWRRSEFAAGENGVDA